MRRTHCIFPDLARPSIVASVVPRSLVLSVLIACNPVPPGSEPGTTTGASNTSGETDGVSSSSAASTPTTTDPATGTSADTTSTTGTTTLEASTTDAVSTTSGDTTMEPPSPTSWTTDPGDDTTDGFVCNWKSDPDAAGFCPLRAGPNAVISGTTPLGPIAFTHAYFGLYGVCADCPYASDGDLVFFSDPDGPVMTDPDRLVLTNSFPTLELHLGDESFGADLFYPENEVIVIFNDLHVPSVAETNPPLDSDFPPILSGKLSITGGGWDVSGEFTATLCRSVDPVISCE